MLKSIIADFAQPQWENSLSESSDSSIVSSHPHTTDPLYDRLLPPQDSPSIYVPPDNRPRVHALFTLSFYFLLCFMGLLSLNYGSAHPIATTIYDLLVDSAVASAVLAGLWLVFLSLYAHVIIVLMVLIVPVLMMAVSVFGIVSMAYSDGAAPEYRYLVGVGCVGLVISAASAILMWTRRSLIQLWISISRLSTEILRINSSLFVLSGLLMVAHMAFTALWMWLFALVLLHTSSWIIPVFYLFMYFWTSNVFFNLERITVSSVVGDWYFMRFEKSTQGDQTWFHLQHVYRKSFGAAVFSALVLGAIRTLKFIIRMAKKRSGSTSLGIIGSCLEFVSSLIENFSSYTLVYVGLTGESLPASAYACTRLFRRNLVLGLLTRNLSQLISFLGKAFVSVSIGLAVFWMRVKYPRENDLKGFEWIIGTLASIVPYYVMGVFTHVVETTTDATFICYLVDLDTNSCHSEGAHAVYSESMK